MCVVRTFRDDLRFQHLVDELVGVLDALGVYWNARHIEPRRRARIRHVIGEIDFDPCIRGTGICGCIIARRGIDHAQFLVGNGIQKIGCIKGADVLADALLSVLL